MWINASPHRYVEGVKDIENFERGNSFMITKRISEHPKVNDFADWHLPEEDFTDLRTCRVGNCELKLSGQTIEKTARGSRLDETDCESRSRRCSSATCLRLRHWLSREWQQRACGLS
jgi:hypothetical protein